MPYALAPTLELVPIASGNQREAGGVTRVHTSQTPGGIGLGAPVPARPAPLLFSPVPPAHPSPTDAAPASPDSSRAGSRGYLPGLDGLRAISVIAVLLYHADLTWIPGGFLGVEVFLVISGYLITTLLLAEHRTLGSIGVRAFWARRARRLLPALFLVLAVVALAAATVYRAEAAELRSQLLGALTYSANWFQILAEQSYFASVERPSPLQHLWSLAIEEQFYLVWPLVLMVLLGVFRGERSGLGRRRGLSTRWIPVVIGGCAVASALLMASLYQPGMDTSRVYYGTDTRAQGLLFGALLAFLWRPALRRDEQARRSAALDNLIGLVGLVGLFLAFFGLSESDRFLFRGGMTMVSILSLMAIVAVVNPATWLARVGLGNKALAAIGRRSYGLYLWHWPIYVFTRPGFDLPFGPYETLALRLVLTGLAAELSYRYIEVPIRNGAIGRWLAALRSPNPAQRAHRRRGVWTVSIGVAAFVVPVSVSLVVASRPLGTVERAVLTGGAPEPAAAVAPTSPVVAAAATPSPSPSPTSTTPPTTVAMPAVSNRRVTVLADSVLLSGKQTITNVLGESGWEVEYRGKPALMLKEAETTLASEGTRVGATVIIGIGYNTLWEHDREDFEAWADLFDTEAEKLLATFTRLGAERFIWVTLREPSKEVIPASGMDQYQRYVWYFPYVNERLRALRDRHPNLDLADWAGVSNRDDVTYDAIHLNPDGANLMVDTIRSVLGS